MRCDPRFETEQSEKKKNTSFLLGSAVTATPQCGLWCLPILCARVDQAVWHFKQEATSRSDKFPEGECEPVAWMIQSGPGSTNGQPIGAHAAVLQFGAICNRSLFFM